MALPHETQRVLTQLRDQEAFAQQRQSRLYDGVRALLQGKAGGDDENLVREKLLGVQEELTVLIGTADEKVSLAQHLHRTVQEHVRRLEDDICCFEEEVRLAKSHGELDRDEQPISKSRSTAGRRTPPRAGLALNLGR